MLGDKGRYEEMRGDARLAPGHGFYTSRTLGFGAGHDSYFPHGGTSRTFRLGRAWGCGPGTGACRLGSYFSYGGTIRTSKLGVGHEV